MNNEINDGNEQKRTSGPKLWSSRKLALVIAAIIALPVIFMFVLPLLLGLGSPAQARKYIGDKNNYQVAEVIVTGIGRYENDRTAYLKRENQQEFMKSDLFFDVYYTTEIDLVRMTGYNVKNHGEPNLIVWDDRYDLPQKIVGILEKNGFFKVYEPGTPIVIRAVREYCGERLHYIASISYDGREYLSFEEGFSALVEYFETK